MGLFHLHFMYSILYLRVPYFQVKFGHHFVLTNIQIENQNHFFQVKFRHYFVLPNVQSANYFFFKSDLDISLHLQMYKVVTNFFFVSNLDTTLYLQMYKVLIKFFESNFAPKKVPFIKMKYENQ